MKILVTGGAGFIGSHLVKKLIDMNHTVITLDNLLTGKITNLGEVIHHPNHTFVQGSVLDRELLSRIINQCDVVYHLAAVLGIKTIVENPLRVIEDNIGGSMNVFELAYKRKCKVVFASTSEVYGKNDNLPFHENSDRLLGPPDVHRWSYATAKAIEEHLCFAYADKGLPVTVVRYFNTYGPRATATQYGGVIPIFITAALKGSPITIHGDGKQTRSFTFIEDTVRGTLLCQDAKHNGQVFNIGMDEVVSINALAEKIKKITASNSAIIYIPHSNVYGKNFEDTPNRIPDLTKSRKILKYSPEIELVQGLRRTVAWYRAEMNTDTERI
ncbi:NAD-dependent epimerase/dehydratase family protein [Paenibacillus mendelii]|uniref:NAD-dependent epimerase/dehydratase family protein n=1 Tax=Paenibacillus mendelii TaxID=206163 RepID=A0ABV6J910_9BACL|nr:NAD-dependent epimerase/dehydratase family protein [Paenibacillus mendelii]MCQ6559709.1 NAD-dependent epimerase/dehydratase family protein [Paenibacillus mendelii]